MPSFRVGPDHVISLSGFSRHNSLFPGSQVAVTLAADLEGFDITKGTIHFDRDRPFRAALLRRILRERIREINADYPRASGITREYFDNGVLKAEGKLRDGELHGAWTWRRRDGSLLRTGNFREGAQVGEWITYGRDGNPHTTTNMGAVGTSGSSRKAPRRPKSRA